MEKRKRDQADGEATCIIRRWCAIKFGLPEVDKIIHGVNFGGLREKLSPPTTRRRISITHMDKTPKVDHINRLSDDILQIIISLLIMREGAATCILSRRWRSLWTTSVSCLSCLNFDIPNMVGYDYPRDMFEKNDEHVLINKISNFTRWVNQVMQLCHASRLDALRVSFVLGKGSASHIDRWIKSAAAQGVTDIELDFNFNDFDNLPFKFLALYEFPAQEVASSIKYLRLKYCIFRLPPDFTSFTSLITLSLTFICVTEGLVDNILSKCPLLECLCLVSCQYPKNTRILRFAGLSLLLKHLFIKSASSSMKYIEVHDINLLSLELTGFVPKLSLKNAPRLTRLVLFTSSQFIETLSNVPRLEILFLSQQFEDSSIMSPWHAFNHLKRLVFVTQKVQTNLLGVLYLIEASHLLQELEINMGTNTPRGHKRSEFLKKLSERPQIPHNNLKEVEIYGFEARLERIEFAKYLLNIAVVLEKMNIYTTSKVYNCNGNWALYEGTAKEVNSLKEVHEQLQEVARSSTKLELSGSLDL